MDWTAGLQRALDYVEEHLTEELDFAEVARQAYSSSFHFQRIFSLLCGCTLGDYIRMRRLTQAAGELVSGGRRVLDVALKYGYDSPESFARAFARFHGVPPSQAKSRHTSLKSFSRLSLKLMIEGGTIMDYRIEKREAFQVIVRKEHFPKGEIGKQQIHALWARCQEDGTIQKLCRYMDGSEPLRAAVLGINLDSPDEDFDYALGAVYPGGEVAEGLSVEEIPAATWAVFPCKGEMPEAFEVLWKKIYTEFFPASEYQPADMCLEVYPGDDIKSPDFTCEFWLSVEKK